MHIITPVHIYVPIRQTSTSESWINNHYTACDYIVTSIRKSQDYVHGDERGRVLG